MELSFYGLRTRPFPLTKDPAFLWFGPPYEEALATLQAAVASNAGFMLLTGEIGAGKSTVVDALVQSLAGSATVVGRITYPKPDLPAFFRRLTDVYRLPSVETRDAFLGEVGLFLTEVVARRQNVLLVIDEVRGLPRELTAAVADLLDLARRIGDRSVLNVLVVDDGDPGADALILGPPVKVRCYLRPLTETEVGAYLRHQLKAAGADRDLFTPEAISRIWAFSGGRPGLVNMSAYHALLTAARQGAALVEAHVVEAYAATVGASRDDRRSPERADRSPRRPPEVRASGRASIVTAALTVGVTLLALAVVVVSHMSPRLRATRARAADTVGSASAPKPVVPAQVILPPATVEPVGSRSAPDPGPLKPAERPVAGVANGQGTPAPKPGPPEAIPAARPPAGATVTRDAQSTARIPERPAAVPRERPPAPRERPASDSAEPDPGAIIDWLLKQGPAGESQVAAGSD